MDEREWRVIREEDRFTIDGVEFVPSWSRASEPNSLSLVKGVSTISAYEELLASFPAPRMVELGISQGGSVGLLAMLARPRKFVAIELDPSPVEPLRRLLHDRGLEESVRPYYGIDQGDRGRLAEVIATEFGTDPIDLVIDDASHLYDPTVASFEVLFPRLRPGGAYVIEDWTWHDRLAHLIHTAAEDTTAAAHGAVVE